MLNVDIRLKLSLLSLGIQLIILMRVNEINGARVPGWLLELNMAQTSSLAPPDLNEGVQGSHDLFI